MEIIRDQPKGWTPNKPEPLQRFQDSTIQRPTNVQKMDKKSNISGQLSLFWGCLEPMLKTPLNR
jgi:hypothetical protein